MQKLFIILLTLISLSGLSQNIFTKDYPSNENYRIPRVKQDFNGDFVLSGYKDVVYESAMRPYVYKVNQYGQKIDSMIYFSGMPYDWYIHDVLIDSSFYYFIGFSGDWRSAGYGPNDSSMFMIKTDYNLNPIDTHYYSIVTDQDIGYATSKFDFNHNIVTAGYYVISAYQIGSFINVINKNGDLLHTNIVPIDSNRHFTNTLLDSTYYYAFGFIWSNTLPALIYKYDTSLNLIDTYVIPNKAQQYYSPIKISSDIYFTSGFIFSSTYPSTMKFAIIKSTIGGVLLDSLEFGFVDSTNFPALYGALCLQNGYMYFVGSVIRDNILPPYGNDFTPSKLYIAKVDTNLNIIWEKLIGGDAYYTAMNVIGTSDGGILMMASRNILNDNKNNLDIRLVKLDSNGNITWIQDIDKPENSLLLYPNPTTDHINLSMSEQPKQELLLEIYNISGQLVLEKQLPAFEKEHRINIQDLPLGVYLVKLVSDSQVVYSGKVVKE